MDLHIIGNFKNFEDYGVKKNMTLMIDNKILVEGYVPRLDEILEILTKELSL